MMFISGMTGARMTTDGFVMPQLGWISIPANLTQKDEFKDEDLDDD